MESEALEAALTLSRSNSVVTGTAGRNCGDLRTETLAGKQLVTGQSGGGGGGAVGAPIPRIVQHVQTDRLR